MDFRSLKSVTTSPDQLDSESVAYLRAVETSAGVGHPGILAWHGRVWFAGPRGGWWVFLFLGLALLGALICLCCESAPRERGSRSLPRVQSVLAGFGTLFLLVGVLRFLRPKPSWLPRPFLYADASYLWEVTPLQIVARPLRELQNVGGIHHTCDGSYAFSDLQLQFPDGIRKYTLYGQQVAENLLNFLQYLLVFRTSEDENVREWAAVSPARLGATAAHFVVCGPGADLSNLPEAADPPEPFRLPLVPSALRYGRASTLLCLLVAAGVGAAGSFAFPLLNDYLQDEYLFAKVPPHDNGQFQAIYRYLDSFPDGRHATRVREILDDRRFAKARSEAAQKNSPTSLRIYLGDKSNQRHRPAARGLIADFYDRTTAELKKKQAREPDKIDKDLFKGILALLEALKRADRPVVTVGFRARLEREPLTGEHKGREKYVHALYLKKHPELKAIAERSPNRTAIINPEQVFDKEQTTRREKVILERLLTAVRKGIKADILTLEPSAPRETPIMEVGYHVLAAGDLGTYRDMNKSLVGLLRWYAIRWTITIRPPGTGKSFVYTLRSNPGNNLTYDSNPNDPSWAIYAVLLYSGFYDMSARLIRNFGLDPGPAPNAFSYAATARHAPPQPDKTQDRVMPFPIEPPKLPDFGEP